MNLTQEEISQVYDDSVSRMITEKDGKRTVTPEGEAFANLLLDNKDTPRFVNALIVMERLADVMGRMTDNPKEAQMAGKSASFIAAVRIGYDLAKKEQEKVQSKIETDELERRARL